jgi:hypothetical protein
MKNANTAISVEEYLSSVYEPGNLSLFPEVRIRVSPTRFRVPDVAVYLVEPCHDSNERYLAMNLVLL